MKCNELETFKTNIRFPWWLSGKEPTCQCRKHRFNPWSGKIPHGAEQLNPCPATEPVLLTCTLEPGRHIY